MENDINVVFLPDNIQECFLDLLDEALNKCGKDHYNDAIYSIINYLSNDKNKMFDYVLTKYPEVTKYQIKQMALSKFLEINYYRIKKDIPVDWNRAILVKKICDAFIETVGYLLNHSAFAISKSDSFFVINDAYIYLKHLSNTYKNSVIKDCIDDGFDEIVSAFYGFTKFDNLKQLSEEQSKKEEILGELIRETMNCIEKKQFSNDTPPLFNSAYYSNCKKALNDDKDIYQNIVDNFIDNSNLYDNDYILIMEMVTSILNYKKDVVLPSGKKMPLSDDEIYLLEEINMASDDKEKIIKLYEAMKNMILKTIVSCIFDIDKEDILKFNFEFNNNKKID